MKKLYYSLLTIIFFISTSQLSQAQTQKGQDIIGGLANDVFGYSVSMPDANTLAIGAPTLFKSTGKVRIYAWDGISWKQKGSDIDGEAIGDQSGTFISMPNANTVAIGAPFNDENGEYSGHVRIYIWNGAKWIQKGKDLGGKAEGDRFGSSVSMPDSNTVAIGAIGSNGNDYNSGHVSIFSWNGENWLQKGIDINGEAANDQSGKSISMPDANTVAISAVSNDGNDGNDYNSGHVRIFTWNVNKWEQKGTDIDGEAAGVYFGYCVSMPDANTVAIGTPEYNGNGASSGYVRIFTWNGIKWIQKGKNLEGKIKREIFGWSASMPDSNTVAIGAIGDGENDNNSGLVRIYIWKDNKWIQKGEDIKEKVAREYLGHSVCMPNALTVAIGAPYYNNGKDNAVGQVRIYELSNEFYNSRIDYVECNDSFTVPSGRATYTENGIYFDTLKSVNNSDSILKIDLRFAKHSTSTINVTSCQPYTSSNGEIYPRSGTYFDTIPNFAGCDSIITIHFVLENSDTAISPTLFAPNAFSPNGDGINDIFKIGYCGYTNFECIVYGSTGQIVAFSHNPDAIWDGTFNGIDYPIGTYKYSIKATDFQGKDVVYSGTVQLLR